MSQRGFIILGIVLFVVLYIMYKINTVQLLDYQLGVPKEVSLRNGQVSFLLPLRIINPSGGTLNLKGVLADINSAGKYLGRATISESATIGPRSETVVNIAVSIQYSDLLTAAGGIWTKLKGGSIGLEIDGVIYVEGLSFPLNSSFDFTLPKI